MGDDVSIDSETLLMIDFVNRKIKLAQSFRVTYTGSVCVHVLIVVSACSICVYIIFLKK
jgi:hypothetical protein